MSPFDKALGRILRAILGVLLALLGAACSPGSPSVSDGGSPAFAPEPSAPQSVTVVLKSGVDFTCFALNLEDGGRIYCRRGASPNPNLGLPAGSGFQLFATHSTEVTHFEVWDDSLCFSGLVSLRPSSRTQGQATYCFGEATLGPAYSGYPLVYSGPPFAWAQHGSPEVTLSGSEQPFTGGDVGIGLFTNAGGVWNVMMDGLGSTGSDSEDCTEDGVSLVCETFSVTL